MKKEIEWIRLPLNSQGERKRGGCLLHEGAGRYKGDLFLLNSPHSCSNPSFQSASFSCLQSPFWSHHWPRQAIPFSPVWPSILLYSVKFARKGSFVPRICILNPREARHGLRMSAAMRVGAGGKSQEVGTAQGYDSLPRTTCVTNYLP